MKTKNAPKDLKCKINHTFFLETGVPKRGGVRHLGKIPKKSRFLGGGASLNSSIFISKLLLLIEFFLPSSLFHSIRTSTREKFQGQNEFRQVLFAHGIYLQKGFCSKIIVCSPTSLVYIVCTIKPLYPHTLCGNRHFHR